MDLLGECTISLLSFSKHTIGIITHPYQTYRTIVDRGRWGELLLIWCLCVLYFSLASLVKTAGFHPILLTKQFIVLIGGALSGYVICLALFGITGKLLAKSIVWERLAVAWGYTLIPTVVWFLMTSFLYVIIPPPRTESISGIGFSLLYLIFTTILFFWKAELYYLTLRFGLKLDLFKIIVVTAVYIPVFGLYSATMYRLGILRVPFL